MVFLLLPRRDSRIRIHWEFFASRHTFEGFFFMNWFKLECFIHYDSLVLNSFLESDLLLLLGAASSLHQLLDPVKFVLNLKRPSYFFLRLDSYLQENNFRWFYFIAGIYRIYTHKISLSIVYHLNWLKSVFSYHCINLVPCRVLCPVFNYLAILTICIYSTIQLKPIKEGDEHVLYLEETVVDTVEVLLAVLLHGGQHCCGQVLLR